MADVSLRNIRKRYGELEVVHGVDLDIRDGEFLVLVGPSGCGKSTILRMVAGLETISDGEMRIGGDVVNKLEPKDRNIAMVFQNYALYPHMSVYKNMAYGLKVRGRGAEEIDRRVREAAATLGLEPYLDRKPRALSGGQRQRVAMGRAIVRNPSVFLLDEPLSNLDAKLRNQMRVELKRLHNRLGNTFIYVTHDQVEAMTLGQRIMVMKDGYVEQVGTPDEIYNHPQSVFVAGFMGSPGMNLIHAEASGRSVVLDGMTLTADTDLPAKVVLGVRPEQLAVAEGGPCAVSAAVELVEPLGGHTIVHCRMATDDAIIVQTAPDAVLREGHSMNLCFEPASVHVFDAESGKRIETALT